MNFFKSLMATTTVTTNPGTDNLRDIIDTINNVVSATLGILTAAVVIYAVFIAYKFFTADDDGKRKNAKAQLIYAIVGVIVLIALLIFAPQITNAVKNQLETNNGTMFMVF